MRLGAHSRAGLDFVDHITRCKGVMGGAVLAQWRPFLAKLTGCPPPPMPFFGQKQWRGDLALYVDAVGESFAAFRFRHSDRSQ
ncbi:hypothetical protein BTE77_26035 [Ensifer adhaerens]|nr:hypothetical protein N182_26140 [Sinorhizobium sp. GL2]OKP70725.1 hypothetical protein BTE77_26035 [Ensifer adhaerens]